MTASRYLRDHERRFELTIAKAGPFLEGKVRIGVVGISPFDKALASALSGRRFTTIIPNSASMEHFDRLSPTFPDTIFVDLASKQPEARPNFEAIFFTEVLEHILGADDTIISNLASLLGPEGVLVVSVPNAATLDHRIRLLFGGNVHWPKRDILVSPNGGFGHIREYTVREVVDLLAPQFRVVLVEGISGYRRGALRIANLLPPTFANTILAVGCKRTGLSREVDSG